MTVINGSKLLDIAPIVGMAWEKHREHGVSHGLAEVGYDIRLKQDVMFEERLYKQQYQMCCRRWSEDEPLRRRGRPTKGGSLWQPGRFVIASAIEEFAMPDNLVGIVHDKSTWARRGLSVFNTVIEPGWCGFLTLELVYHGQEELHIPAGAGIAQVIFHEVAVPAQYRGKYQNQADQPVEAIIG